MNNVHSLTIEQAMKEYPTIKTTVNLAKAVGIKVTGHAVTYTARGRVYQHKIWFEYGDGTRDYMPNNNFVNMCRGRKDVMERVVKENVSKSDNPNA